MFDHCRVSAHLGHFRVKHAGDFTARLERLGSTVVLWRRSARTALRVLESQARLGSGDDMMWVVLMALSQEDQDAVEALKATAEKLQSYSGTKRRTRELISEMNRLMAGNAASDDDDEP
jgi:hypothetical protein